MRKLFLHVGVHRTGTTSTQKFLRQNFDILRGRGYLYPFGVARHEDHVRRMARGNLSVADFADDLQRRADSHATGIHSVIISDEDMSCIRDFSLFAPLSRQFDVRVVVSLRRQDLWLESWYLQNVKWQWQPALSHLPFAEFMDRRDEFFWIDYAERLAHYEAIFGEGSVVASVFERTDMPQGPIAAFLGMVGIHDHSGFGPFDHANSSLSPKMSEFVRLLPLDRIEPPERRLLEKAIAEVDARLETNGSKLVMPHDQRLRVLEEFAGSNARTATRYIGRDLLFNDPVPGADAPLADMDIPLMSSDLMRDFVSPIFAALGTTLHTERLARAAPNKSMPRKAGGPKTGLPAR